MANDLYTDLLSTFDDVLNAVGGGELVVNGDASGQGIVSYDSTPEQGMTGVNENVSGKCRAKYEEIGSVTYSQAVKIGARTVFVTAHRLDPAKAIASFDFASTSPVTAGGVM